MNKQQGIIKLIVLIIIGILILSYFRVDIRRIVESDIAQKNLNYVWGLVQYVWHNFLAAPAAWIWDRVVVDLLWSNFSGFIDRAGSKLTPTQ
jgi:hypothetical protein